MNKLTFKCSTYRFDVLFVDCEEDLVKAEPALSAAQEALNTLNKNNLTELKSFGSPPGAVTNVTAAVMGNFPIILCRTHYTKTQFFLFL